MRPYKTLATAFLCLIFGVPLLLTAIISTGFGLNWAAQTVLHITRAPVTIARIEGQWWSTIVAHDVQINTGANQLSATRVEVQWSPWSLFDGELDVHHVYIDSPNLSLASSTAATTAESKPVTLDIAAPLPIQITKLRVSDGELHRAEIDQPFAAELALSWQRHKVTTQITRLHVGALTVAGDASLSLTPTLSHQLRLSADYEAAQHYRATVELRGNSQTSDAQVNVSQPQSVAVTAQLQQLLTDLHFSGKIRIAQPLKPQQWLADLPDDLPQLQGTMQFDGDLEAITLQPDVILNHQQQQMALTGKISVALKQHQAKIHQAEITLSEGLANGQLAVSGELNWQQPQHPHVALNAKWQQLNLQLPQQPTIQSTTGDLSVVGTRQHLQVELQQQLQIAEQQFGKMHSSLTLLPESAHIEHQLKDYNGNLVADISWHNKSLQIEQFNADFPHLTASASGNLTDSIDWDLMIADLSMLPIAAVDVAGKLKASGQVSGSLQDPRVNTHVTINELKLNQTSLGDVSTRLAGTLSEHHLELSIASTKNHLETRVDGSYQDQQWQGTINQLALNIDNYDQWQQLQPTPLRVSPTQQKLGELCLKAQSNQQLTCIQGEHQGQSVSFASNIEYLPVVWLEPWLKLPLGTNLEGGFKALAEGIYDINQQRFNKLDAEVSGQSFRIRSNRIPEPITFKQLRLTAQQQPAKPILMNAILQPESFAGLASASVTLEDFRADSPIKGKIDVTLDDLALVNALISQVEQAKGHAQAEITINGKLQQPVLSGHANVVASQLLIPQTGTLINDLTATVSDAQTSRQQFEVTVKGRAGNSKDDGNFAARGWINPLQRKGQITLRAERATVIDTPELKLTLSPDIDIRLQPERTELSGTVRVPSARIAKPDMSNTVTASSDVVVVKNGEPVRDKMVKTKHDLYADIKVVLGDDVQVKALGFKGQLNGSLVIHEQPKQPTTATGSVNVNTGEYEIYGQKLNVEKGSFIYTGTPIDNPGLDLRVTRRFTNPAADPAYVKVGAQVAGTLNNPSLNLFSDPSMPDSDILSYLVLGRAPGAGETNADALQLQAAILLGTQGTNVIGKNVKDAFGLDTFGIDNLGNSTEDTSFYIGKYLSPDLYVKYGIGLLTPINTFFLRYRLTDNLFLESHSSTQSQGGDIIYSFETN